MTAPDVYADASLARNSAISRDVVGEPESLHGIVRCEHREERLRVLHAFGHPPEPRRVDRSRRDHVGADSGPYSTAIWRVSAISPALAAPYAA